jgi:hypothetical protein
VPVDHLFRRSWVHKLALEPPAIGLYVLADTPSIARKEKSQKAKKKASNGLFYKMLPEDICPFCRAGHAKNE